MYHSLIINVDDRYINTWDDWFLIPSSRPVISPPIERTSFKTVPGRDGKLDYSQSISHKAVFDNRTGKIEFYLENDISGWDWETAYTTICEILKGKRVRFALEDNPAHYYKGLLWVNGFKSQKGNSTITLEYDVHPTMYILNVGAVVMDTDSIRLTKGMEYQILVGVGPTNTFFRKVNVTAKPKTVAEITADGLVRGLRKGEAVITAECGGVKAECSVTVGDFEKFKITRTLDGCAETNPVNEVVLGGKYRNIIAVKDTENTTLSLSVTMNGADVTSSCVKTDESGMFAESKIESVDGEIVISASAAAKPAMQMLNDIPVVAVQSLKEYEKGGV